MRKIAIWMLGFFGVAVVITFTGIVIAHFSHQPSTGKSISTTPPVSTPTTVPSVAGGSSNVQRPTSNRLQLVVAAAAVADNEVTVSQFLEPPAMRRILNRYVVPAKRSALERAFSQVTGPALAKALEYPDIETAHLSANYEVVTQKYRVDSYETNRAVVTLFTLTRFRTSQDNYLHQQHWMPSLTVVNMQRVNGRWLYLSAGSPPADQMPTPKLYLTYPQAVLRYLPYLKGFSDYVQTS